MRPAGKLPRAIAFGFLTLVSAAAAHAQWKDDLDSYLTGSTIIGQGNWVGWQQTGTDDSIVTAEKAFTAPHSLKMGALSQVDLIPEFEGVTSGVWFLDVMTYVPAASTVGVSDIGFLARHTGFQDAIDTQWFGPFQLNMDNNTVSGNAAMPIIRDRWIPVNIVFDIDARAYEIFYDGESARSGEFNADHDSALVALDVWTSPGSAPLYYDDFRVTPAVPPPPLVITQVSRDEEANTLTLTWRSKPGKSYTVWYSLDLASWPGDLEDGLGHDPDGDGLTSVTLKLDGTPLDGLLEWFVRIEER